MLRAAIVFGLVAAVLARPENFGYSEQYIRVGNVGTSLSFLNGLLVPTMKSSDDGAPIFEFRTTINGAPIAENDYYNYRCGAIDYAPLFRNPSFLCRSVDFEKGSANPVGAVFLLNSEQLTLAPEVKEIHILFGKSSYNNFMSMNPYISAAPPAPAPFVAGAREARRHYDGYSIISSEFPYHSFLVPSTDSSIIRASENHNIQAPIVPPMAGTV